MNSDNRNIYEVMLVCLRFASASPLDAVFSRLFAKILVFCLRFFSHSMILLVTFGEFLLFFNRFEESLDFW